MVKRIFNVNDSYFNILNMQNCYWGGFIAADGCVLSNKPVFTIDSKLEDTPHIQKLANSLDYSGRVKLRTVSCRLEFTSRDIIRDLYNHFNITPRKSLTLCSPNIDTEDYIRAFIRGYMDGDGSIWFEYNKSNAILKQWRLSFAGTEFMLTWIKDNVRQYVNRAGNPSVRHIRRDSQIKQLVFGGTQVKDILSWLYFGSTDNTRLSRKYDKYLEVRLG